MPPNGCIPVVKMEQIPKLEALVGPARGDLVVGSGKIKGPIEILQFKAVLVENHPYPFVRSAFIACGLRPFDCVLHQTVGVHSRPYAVDLHLILIVWKPFKIISGTLGILTQDENPAGLALSWRFAPSVFSFIRWHGRRPPGNGLVGARLRRGRACIGGRISKWDAPDLSRCPPA